MKTRKDRDALGARLAREKAILLLTLTVPEIGQRPRLLLPPTPVRRMVGL